MTQTKIYEVILTKEETEALNQAQEIASGRFALANIEYTKLISEKVQWSLLGVLKSEGIPAMLQYAMNAKLLN